MTEDDIVKSLAEKAKEILGGEETKSVLDRYTPKQTHSGFEWVDNKRGGALPASKIEVLLYEILQELRGKESERDDHSGCPICDFK